MSSFLLTTGQKKTRSQPQHKRIMQSNRHTILTKLNQNQRVYKRAHQYSNLSGHPSQHKQGLWSWMEIWLHKAKLCQQEHTLRNLVHVL